jgi:hypothetical protein
MMCILHCKAEGLGEGSAKLVLEADGTDAAGVLTADTEDDCDESSWMVEVELEEEDDAVSR